MKFGILELLALLGSVGMFLYGMKLMSEGLQKAAGDKLRHIMALMTNNRFIGALTGIFITALVQSSSATTVMIVSFVNAGLISLTQSMAVIMGANVGTTVTAWIISLFGFKVNIASFAIPLIAFAMPLLLAKKNSYKNWGEFLLGFSFLFLGLEYLQHSVPDLSANPEMFAVLQDYSDMGYLSIVIFMLVGMLLTMVVQASSATFAIALIMCSKGWISFDIAAALVLGSNIGTCITPILASISANALAKRAAMGHLLFNVLGSVWTLILYYPFIRFIVFISTSLAGNPNDLAAFADSADPAFVRALNDRTLDLSVPENAAAAARFADMQYYVSFGLSMFHTVFNLINISIMIWFTGLYVKAVNWLVPMKESGEDEESHLTYVSVGLMSTAELSILQARKEIVLYAERTQRMFAQVRDLYNETDESEFVKRFSRIQKYENISDRMEVEIATYLGKVSNGRLSDDAKHQIQMKMRIISEIESIADSCYNLARTLQRRFNSEEKFTQDLNDNVGLMFNLMDSALDQMRTVLGHDTITVSEVNRTQNIENEINNFRNQLKTQNVIDVNDGKYSYVTGITYMDIVGECEKLGDYVVNVVEVIADTKLYNYALPKMK